MSENNTNPMPGELLNQILIEIRDIKGEINGIKGEIGNINTRLDRVEARLMETNKLDKLIGEVADLRMELADFKKVTHKDSQEIKKLIYKAVSDIADHDLRLTKLEEE